MSQQQIIQDILSRATTEAQKISEDTDLSIARRREALEQREKEMADEARASVQRQTEAMKSRADRNSALQTRRIRLELQERVNREVTKRIRRRVVDLRGTDAYADLLREWTVEAVIGLGLDVNEAEGSARGTIRCAAADQKLLSSLLPDVYKRVQELTGNSVVLEIDPTPLPEGDSTAGVVVTAANGRQAFSNRIDDRLRRFEHHIQTLVTQRLFSGDQLSGDQLSGDQHE
ncbi:MAG: V-type ATP synthase subunit E family protein [Alkalispirochaeta sp.]